MTKKHDVEGKCPHVTLEKKKRDEEGKPLHVALV